MTLRVKRNLPLVLTLAVLLILLVLVTGNQPIVSYTFNTEALGTASFTAIGGNASSLAGLFNILQP